MIQKKSIQRIALVGLLTAAALVLSLVESLAPPIPGMPPGGKLGLSNLATMLAAREIGLFPSLAIAAVKAGFTFLTRGSTAFLLSLCGGLLSAATGYLLLRLPKQPFGPIGLGICCALMHNAGQLLAALLLMGPAMLYYLPFLALFSVFSGSVTGILFHRIPLHSKLFKKQDGDSPSKRGNINGT